MEDALEVFADVDRECINKHSKERIVDSFIDEFRTGIPMFVSFRAGLAKPLEFFHRRLQLEHVPRRIAFTLMESFSTCRNCVRLDNPEDSSDTSGTSAEPMAVEQATPAERVGPMSDPHMDFIGLCRR